MWQRLWGLKVQGKVKHFLWRAIHKLLRTFDQLLQKGIVIDGICKSCGEAPESIEHLFFQCSKAKLVWKLSSVCWDGLQTLTLNFKSWWRQLCGLINQANNQDRLELTAYVLWNIWKMPNNWCFNATTTPSQVVIARSQQEWHEMKEIEESHKKSKQPSTNYCTSQSGHHLRVPSTVGYPTLDISFTSLRQSQKSSTGFLAYDHHSRLLHAKASIWNEHHEANRLALEAIRAAQLLAYQWGWKRVTIRSDVQEMVSKLHNNQQFPSELATISADIILLTYLFDDCQFLYIKRHKNSLCRKLALYALECPFSVSWDSNLPTWLSNAS